MTTVIERPAIDEEDRFPGLAQLLDAFLEPQLISDVDPLRPDRQLAMFIERLALDLPIELQMLRDEDNRLALGTSTPTQWIDTSVQPVLHRLLLTLELDHDEPRDPGLES